MKITEHVINIADCSSLRHRPFDQANRHRNYIGGMWEKIGSLQFDFLVDKGLKPTHYLLDLACGSLRLGVKVIPYLEADHYLGVEKELGLVLAGLTRELPNRVREDKRPRVLVSPSFEFEKLPQKADFIIAQSLFSHLPADLIALCFSKLHLAMNEGGVLYATFNLTAKKQNKPRKDYGSYAYTREEISEFGQADGFSSNYIGNWNHPRYQVMAEYRKGQ